MEVVLYRVDERLIHGQVMVAWIGKTGANSVVIVDEKLGEDDFMKQVFQLAAPSNIKVYVTGREGFRDMLDDQSDHKAIVLFKGPFEALEALKDAVPVGELIVGNVATAPGRKKYTHYAYMSDEEKQMLADLQEVGWKVNLQLLPYDSKCAFAK